MTHKKLQKEVTKLLVELSGDGYNVVSSNRRGRPDIVGYIFCIHISIEVKVGRDTLRPAQRATLLNECKKGAIGIVLHEKHLSVFEAYVRLIATQVLDGVTPALRVGKPIPDELMVKPFENVVSMGATVV